MRSHAILKGALVVAMAASVATAASGEEYKARLDGFSEVGALTGPTGAILTDGTGRLTLDVDRNIATYTLTYSDLSSSVTQAHLHFGKEHVAGGIYAFLCTNLNNVPAGAPAAPPCPSGGGTVTGTLTSANILAVPGQNIAQHDFEALLAAVRSNTTYANVHTTKFPAGEIRGQVQHSNADKDD